MDYGNAPNNEHSKMGGCKRVIITLLITSMKNGGGGPLQCDRNAADNGHAKIQYVHTPLLLILGRLQGAGAAGKLPPCC